MTDYDSSLDYDARGKPRGMNHILARDHFTMDEWTDLREHLEYAETLRAEADNKRCEFVHRCAAFTSVERHVWGLAR